MSYRALAMALLLTVPGVVQARDAKPSLEQRVQRMEDESAIRKVLIEYGAFLDAKDYHSYAGLFASQGVWQGGFGTFTGPAAIEKMLVDNLGAPEPGFVNKANFHLLSNPIIEIDGDRAHVTSKYLFWTKSADNKPTPLLAGRYVDDFVRENGQWKIAKRATWGAIPFRDPNEPPAAGGGPAAASPALSTDQRLQRAEDHIAIERVIVDYAEKLDARDFDGYAALFAHDGTWQTGQTVRRGPGEIKAMLVGLFGATPPGYVNGADYHLVSNVEVDVDGDHAHARSRHLMMTRDKQGHPTPTLAGWYEDEFVRENGEWKIFHRIDHPLMPTAEEWVKEMAARRPR
uniref:nuclear transport factor 2 family protein n=1 Tax=Altererythrobacter segetis TaxID=1104773 RepID=UPI00140934AF|nr:nuclear transport factor 2 family protein [Altererythrobacter segetis]